MIDMDALNAARARSGLTWRDVAKEICVSESTMYRWVHRGDVGTDVAQRLVRLFHMDSAEAAAVFLRQ